MNRRKNSELENVENIHMFLIKIMMENNVILLKATFEALSSVLSTTRALCLKPSTELNNHLAFGKPFLIGWVENFFDHVLICKNVVF